MAWYTGYICISSWTLMALASVLDIWYTVGEQSTERQSQSFTECGQKFLILGMSTSYWCTLSGNRVVLAETRPWATTDKHFLGNKCKNKPAVSHLSERGCTVIYCTGPSKLTSHFCTPTNNPFPLKSSPVRKFIPLINRITIYLYKLIEKKQNYITYNQYSPIKMAWDIKMDSDKSLLVVHRHKHIYMLQPGNMTLTH